jgi:hypothetical protein
MESVNESFILTVGLCSPSLSGVEGSTVERLGVITMLKNFRKKTHERHETHETHKVNFYILLSLFILRKQRKENEKYFKTHERHETHETHKAPDFRSVRSSMASTCLTIYWYSPPLTKFLVRSKHSLLTSVHLLRDI